MEYVFGDDTRRYELRRAGVPVRLRPEVFHLLAYLLAHRDRVVSRQELGAHLWPKQFVSEATLDACLAQARQAVGDSDPDDSLSPPPKDSLDVGIQRKYTEVERPGFPRQGAPARRRSLPGGSPRTSVPRPRCSLVSERSDDAMSTPL
jgi:hypothetical protein